MQRRTEAASDFGATFTDAYARPLRRRKTCCSVVDMGITPIRPEHADRDYPIRGADPRLTIRRHLTGYAYPANGNVHNPTPHYEWWLLADGRVVGQDSRKRALVAEAQEYGMNYLAEIDAR